MVVLASAITSQKPFDWFRDGDNTRIIVENDSLRELCHSIVANGLLQPVGAIDHGDYGTTIHGFRRLEAIRYGNKQKLAVPTLISVSLYPLTITPTQIQVIT